jgi:hypothetical protein
MNIFNANLGGFTLGSGSSTQIFENPEGNYTQELYVWYRDQKPNMEIRTISTSVDASGVFGVFIIGIYSN